MKAACLGLLLVVIVLAGLAPPSQGQVQFPGNNNQQQRPTRPPPRPRPTTRPTATQPPVNPSSSTLPPPNPEVPVVFTVKCQCPFTPEYNPVCGSDGQTYGNRQILNCARICGANVNYVVNGGCGQNRG